MSVDPGDDTQPRVGTRLACTAARAIRVASGGAWAQVEEETGVPRASLGDPEMLGCLPKPSALGSDGVECGDGLPCHAHARAGAGVTRRTLNHRPCMVFRVRTPLSAAETLARYNAVGGPVDQFESLALLAVRRAELLALAGLVGTADGARGKGEVESGGEGLEGWEMVGDHVGAVELLQAIWNREEQ